MSRRQTLSGLAMAAAGLSGVTACGQAPATATPAPATAATVERRAPGSLIWRVRAGSGVGVGDSVTSSVVAADGMVYVASNVQGSGDCVTYCLHASTGHSIWSSDGNGPFPYAAGPGAVFGFRTAPGGISQVIASNATSGRALWIHDAGHLLGNAATGWLRYARGVVYTAAGISQDVTAAQPSVRALDARTGRPIWTARLDSSWQAPVLANGVLYATTATGVVALNAETGTRLWRSTALTTSLGAVVVTDGVVCCGDAVSLNGTPVFALAGATGRLLWHEELGPPQCGASGVIVFTPTPGDNGQSTMWARHARTGKPAWKRPTQQGFGVMIASAGVVYYGAPLSPTSATSATGDGLLYAIDAVSGRPLWTYRVSAPVTGLAASDGVLYAADAKGSVCALQA
jgi:outer membrane protein assembly factor BamB